MSRTAIHLIETGRSRPSLETLELIARQTGKPLDFFLPPPAEAPMTSQRRERLRELERLSLGRDFKAVIELGPALLEQTWDQEASAIIHFHIGQAHCRLVQPREALEHLPVARDAFERLGDEWMAVEALDWESSALGLLEDPRAIPLADEALARCRKLDPRPAPVEARILGHIANMYVVAQSWAQAIHYYEASVEAAGSVKDLLQLAKMHHGLGSAYQRLQQPTTARRHFDKALALYSIESDLSSVYRLENDLGVLLLRQGQLDSAAKHLRTALSGSEALAIDRRGRGFILASLGDVSLQQGRLAEATGYLQGALEAAQAAGEHVVTANAHELLGQLSEREGDVVDADSHFEVAIRTLQDLEMPDRLRECLMEYAELLDARGDLASAARRWKQAAEIGRLSALGLPLNRAESYGTDEVAEMGGSAGA